ncbi:hypothetical protein chiPu_0012829 [Chiloscyllium punctatum]|uniref:Uncharacterized protein n=1 Tax=Chiloscyllium punctatum TaxID=137246 RepID=A0A401SVI7_CHIPU|nr:hypothetical protein [Chiloscyllium punctatum]
MGSTLMSSQWHVIPGPRLLRWRGGAFQKVQNYGKGWRQIRTFQSKPEWFLCCHLGFLASDTGPSLRLPVSERGSAARRGDVSSPEQGSQQPGASSWRKKVTRHPVVLGGKAENLGETLVPDMRYACPLACGITWNVEEVLAVDELGATPM